MTLRVDTPANPREDISCPHAPRKEKRENPLRSISLDPKRLFPDFEEEVTRSLSNMKVTKESP